MSYTAEMRGYLNSLAYITESYEPEIEIEEILVTPKPYEEEISNLLSELENITFKLLNNRLTEGKSSSFADGFEESSMWSQEMISEVVRDYSKRFKELSGGE